MENQDERLDYLFSYFIKDAINTIELDRFFDLDIPEKFEDKIDLLRILMNVRYPKRMPKEIRLVQDEFFRILAEERGIIDIKDIASLKEEYSFTKDIFNYISIFNGDITRLSSDGIVNAGDKHLLGCFLPLHDCIDNTIHFYAGVGLRNYCNSYMNKKKKEFGDDFVLPASSAVITRAYNLPSKFIIHGISPETGEDISILKETYLNVFDLAVNNGIKTLGLPLISNRHNRFPVSLEMDMLLSVLVDLYEKDIPFERIILITNNDIERKLYERKFKSINDQ